MEQIIIKLSEVVAEQISTADIRLKQSNLN